jgi:PAS domain S-box-containing protein
MIVTSPEAIITNGRADRGHQTVEDDTTLVAENALHVTAVLASDLKINYISTAVQSVLGHNPQALCGANFTALVHPEDVPAVTNCISKCVREPRISQFFEFRCRDATSTWRAFEAIATGRVNNQGSSVVVLNARDITERKWSAQQLQRSHLALRAIHDVARDMDTRATPTAVGAALLEAVQTLGAVEGARIFMPTGRGQLRATQSFGAKHLLVCTRRARAARGARRHAFEEGAPRFFRLAPSNRRAHTVEGWSVPLRAGNRTLGVLEVFGRGLAAGTACETLASLADQAASALERERLIREVAARERRQEDLVRQLLLAQEKERRRVAYEVHDGLAQLTVAAQQHLECFASHYRPRSPRMRDELDRSVALVRRTVGEARRLIAGLRPTVLDDFGLAAAVQFEVETLRADGWQVDFVSHFECTQRLPATVETTLFRVVQEALANVRRHAGATVVNVRLECGPDLVHVEIHDRGRGFDPTQVLANGPSERVGLVGMRERVACLGGRLVLRSRPGGGTRVLVDVPLKR